MIFKNAKIYALTQPLTLTSEMLERALGEFEFRHNRRHRPSAMLAGLLKAPSRYSPTNDLASAQNRAAVIVGLMQDQGYITLAEARAALASPAILSRSAAARAGGSFADWIMEEAPDYLTRQTSEDVEIRTTFDPAIQRAAEAADG